MNSIAYVMIAGEDVECDRLVRRFEGLPLRSVAKWVAACVSRKQILNLTTLRGNSAGSLHSWIAATEALFQEMTPKHPFQRCHFVRRYLLKVQSAIKQILMLFNREDVDARSPR